MVFHFVCMLTLLPSLLVSSGGTVLHCACDVFIQVDVKPVSEVHRASPSRAQATNAAPQNTHTHTHTHTSPKYIVHLRQGRKPQTQPHKTHTHTHTIRPISPLRSSPPLASQPSQTASSCRLGTAASEGNPQAACRAPGWGEKGSAPFRIQRFPLPGFLFDLAGLLRLIGNLRSPERAQPTLPDPRSLRFLRRPDPEPFPPPLPPPKPPPLRVAPFPIRSGQKSQRRRELVFPLLLAPPPLRRGLGRFCLFLSFLSLFLSFPPGLGESRDSRDWLPAFPFAFAAATGRIRKRREGGEVANCKASPPPRRRRPSLERKRGPLSPPLEKQSKPGAPRTRDPKEKSCSGTLCAQVRAPARL
ncbi:uncharacterized protein LOC120309271 [Crotalus tigris]|uniref:uncharacterized protein LOC120309271 n=1 Tax=Crotalus tigris TaxID=88082 RepID=UPI00192FA724|nr:uncharacterized protein LOC120309271 [Crotalus tigris]